MEPSLVIPVAAAASIVGAPRDLCYDLRDRGLIPKRIGTPGMTRDDVLTLGLAHLLTLALHDSSHARIAARQVLAVLGAALDGHPVEIVWDAGARKASWVTAASELVTAVRVARPVVVLDLGAELHRIRLAFDAEALDAGSTSQPPALATRGAQRKRRPGEVPSSPTGSVLEVADRPPNRP